MPTDTSLENGCQEALIIAPRKDGYKHAQRPLPAPAQAPCHPPCPEGSTGDRAGPRAPTRRTQPNRGRAPALCTYSCARRGPSISPNEA